MLLCCKLIFASTLAMAQVVDGEPPASGLIDESAVQVVDETNEQSLGLGDSITIEEFEADRIPGTRVTADWIIGGNDGFSTFDLFANHTLLFGYGDWPPLEISPGAGIHFWMGPPEIGLPARVYDLYFDLAWRPIDRERWGLSIGITPGWFGDFEVIDGRTFQLSGWGFANYRLNDHWNLVGGVAYIRQTQDNLLPAGGLIWTPNETTRVELLVPRSKIARQLNLSESSSTWWFVAGALGGGTWAVADSPNTNALVAYTDMRLTLGIERFQFDGVESSIEVGYIFARDISIDGFIASQPNDAILIQASIAF